MNTLFIGESVLRTMITVSECSDEECCGFLLGQAGNANRIITKSLTVKNSTKGNRHTNFEISARDYLNAELRAECMHLTLIGVFHSHPNHPAVPSAFDQAAAQPDFSYVIISLIDRKFVEMKSWKMDTSTRLAEEKIELGFIE